MTEETNSTPEQHRQRLESAVLRRLVYEISGADADVDLLEATNIAIHKLKKVDMIEENKATAEHALHVASSGDDLGGETKVGFTTRLIRNELVRRTALGVDSHRAAMTAREAQEMAKPEYELAYPTVTDAWRKLQVEWSCFQETKKDGAKAITVREDDIPISLAEAVQADIGRNDVVKKLLSGDDG